MKQENKILRNKTTRLKNSIFLSSLFFSCSFSFLALQISRILYCKTLYCISPQFYKQCFFLAWHASKGISPPTMLFKGYSLHLSQSCQLFLPKVVFHQNYLFTSNIISSHGTTASDLHFSLWSFHTFLVWRSPTDAFSTWTPMPSYLSMNKCKRSCLVFRSPNSFSPLTKAYFATSYVLKHDLFSMSWYRLRCLTKQKTIRLVNFDHFAKKKINQSTKEFKYHPKATTYNIYIWFYAGRD